MRISKWSVVCALQRLCTQFQVCHREQRKKQTKKHQILFLIFFIDGFILQERLSSALESLHTCLLGGLNTFTQAKREQGEGQHGKTLEGGLRGEGQQISTQLAEKMQVSFFSYKKKILIVSLSSLLLPAEKKKRQKSRIGSINWNVSYKASHFSCFSDKHIYSSIEHIEQSRHSNTPLAVHDNRTQRKRSRKLPLPCPHNSVKSLVKLKTATSYRNSQLEGNRYQKKQNKHLLESQLLSTLLDLK